MIFYTSDLHLGSNNIIGHENRPFKSVEEMDKALIRNWNSRVKPEDDVYVLGDFCFKGVTRAIEYLKLQYPDVLFHSDYGSGSKLTPGQAMKQKRQNGGRRGWPDITITESRVLRCIFWQNGVKIKIPCISPDFIPGHCDGQDRFHGLYIELKKEGEKIYPGPRAKRYKSKDGKEYKNEHIMEQADCLYDLRQRGYCAEFAIGFDEAKRIIDEYLGGK